MVDANQAWTVDVATDMARALRAVLHLGWLEEPLRSRPPVVGVAEHCVSTPISRSPPGENVAQDAGFDAALARRTC